MKIKESPGDIPAEDVVSSLLVEPGTGVCVISSSGDIYYLNRACADIFFGRASKISRIQSYNLAELYGPEFVADRMELIRATLADDTPRLFRAFHRGRQHYSWITPHGDRVLVITRRHGAGADEQWSQPDGFVRVNAGVVGLGPLAQLSPRELATLALIGDGMTDADIAQHLNITIRTARWHRTHISKKLGVHRRIDLAVYVQRIGFRLEDASR